MAWEVRISDPSGTVHIVPQHDRREHDPADCWCVPAVTLDGLYVHNAADRREAFEYPIDPMRVATDMHTKH
jgi:hypothetical protein